MKVIIFGATGMVGKQLMVHCLAKGWEVKAFGRQVEKLIDKDLDNDRFTAIKGYVFDAGEVFDALKDCDAVLSALGGQIDGSDHTRSLGMKNIIAQMEKRGISRIIALGGMGVLDAPNGGGPMYEQKDYPKEFVPVAIEHYTAYEALLQSSLDFTFICSPNITNHEADGQYEALEEGPAENWHIKAGNLALAMVQAIDHHSFSRKRVGIGDRS